MDKYIHRFPEQLLDAIKIGEAISVTGSQVPVNHVVICGMGGSGIGGLFTKEITQHEINIPVILNQDYELPVFVNEQTLVICSSYSGNTEETISALQEAIARKCNIVCITTGGEIGKIAAQHQLVTVNIPGGMPPRTCIGYSMVAQLYILHKAGLLSEGFKQDIISAAALLTAKSRDIQAEAEQLSAILKNKIPVIYTSSEIEAVGKRWKQQINENAKMHCFSNVIPEMNHNELVSYAIRQDEIGVILLRNRTDNPRIQKRFDITKELISGKAGSVTELYSEGNNYIGRLFYLIHLGDWVSYHLSQHHAVDPVEIRILDELKNRLKNT